MNHRQENHGLACFGEKISRRGFPDEHKYF